MNTSCHVCESLRTADDDQIVYDQGPWTAYVRSDVPGWVMLAAKEHVEGMWSLSADQAGSLGPAIRTIAAAVEEATGANRTHLVFLGENALHFHLGFFPRQADEPALFGNESLLAALRTDADPERASAVGAQIRDRISGR